MMYVSQQKVTKRTDQGISSLSPTECASTASGMDAASWSSYVDTLPDIFEVFPYDEMSEDIPRGKQTLPHRFIRSGPSSFILESIVNGLKSSVLLHSITHAAFLDEDNFIKLIQNIPSLDKLNEEGVYDRIISKGNLPNDILDTHDLQYLAYGEITVIGVQGIPTFWGNTKDINTAVSVANIKDM